MVDKKVYTKEVYAKPFYEYWHTTQTNNFYAPMNDIIDAYYESL